MITGNHVVRNNNGSAERKGVTLLGDVQLLRSRRDVCVIGEHEAATRVPDCDSTSCYGYDQNGLFFATLYTTVTAVFIIELLHSWTLSDFPYLILSMVF